MPNLKNECTKEIREVLGITNTHPGIMLDVSQPAIGNGTENDTGLFKISIAAATAKTIKLKTSTKNRKQEAKPKVKRLVLERRRVGARFKRHR